MSADWKIKAWICSVLNVMFGALGIYMGGFAGTGMAVVSAFFLGVFLTLLYLEHTIEKYQK